MRLNYYSQRPFRLLARLGTVHVFHGHCSIESMRMLSKFSGLIGPQRPFRMSTFFWFAAAIALVDQISKLVMVAYFKPLIDALPDGRLAVLEARPDVTLIPDFFHFKFAINTGAAFSFLTNHTGFLTVISLVISIFVLVWAWSLKPGEQGLRLSQGLIFGGAVGNFIDRLRLGYVIDFIDVHWRDEYHWPTFNIADSAICVGIGLLVLASFCVGPTAAETAAPVGSKKSSEVS